MPTYNDYGIVLSSYNLAEADKILNIYTKENGLVRAIGKGLRKSSSKLSGKVDQLSCCHFHFACGKHLDIISECEQINSFPQLRSSLLRLTHGILFLEIVGGFAHEKESESVQVYDLLYSSLEKLQIVHDPFLFSVNFILDFLSIHGYKPQLATCVSCSKEVQRSEDIVYPYSTILGGLLCKECARLIEHKSVSHHVLEIIEQGTTSISTHLNESVRFGLNLLREHIEMRAKNKIRTFDLVFSL